MCNSSDHGVSLSFPTKLLWNYTLVWLCKGTLFHLFLTRMDHRLHFETHVIVVYKVPLRGPLCGGGSGGWRHGDVMTSRWRHDVTMMMSSVASRDLWPHYVTMTSSRQRDVITSWWRHPPPPPPHGGPRRGTLYTTNHCIAAARSFWHPCPIMYSYCSRHEMSNISNLPQGYLELQRNVFSKLSNNR